MVVPLHPPTHRPERAVWYALNIIFDLLALLAILAGAPGLAKLVLVTIALLMTGVSDTVLLRNHWLNTGGLHPRTAERLLFASVIALSLTILALLILYIGNLFMPVAIAQLALFVIVVLITLADITATVRDLR